MRSSGGHWSSFGHTPFSGGGSYRYKASRIQYLHRFNRQFGPPIHPIDFSLDGSIYLVLDATTNAFKYELSSHGFAETPVPRNGVRVLSAACASVNISLLRNLASAAACYGFTDWQRSAFPLGPIFTEPDGSTVQTEKAAYIAVQAAEPSQPEVPWSPNIGSRFAVAHEVSQLPTTSGPTSRHPGPRAHATADLCEFINSAADEARAIVAEEFHSGDDHDALSPAGAGMASGSVCSAAATVQVQKTLQSPGVRKRN